MSTVDDNNAAPSTNDARTNPPTPVGLGDLAIGSNFGVGIIAGIALAWLIPERETSDVAELASVGSVIVRSSPILGAALGILLAIWLALKKGAAVTEVRAQQSHKTADWASLYAFRDVEALVGWVASGLSVGYLAWIVGQEWPGAATSAAVALIVIWAAYGRRRAVQAKHIGDGVPLPSGVAKPQPPH